MKGGFFLDVVVGQGSSIFQLFSGKDETLLIWWDSFFVLNLRLNVPNRVIRLDIQGDRFSRKSLDEDLHGTTTKTKDKVKGGLFLNVVIQKRTSIFQLFTSENESLLFSQKNFRF